MILADKIIDLRKKNGWSQEELAEKLGVSRQAVSKWESAQAIPDLGRVLAMADLFSVTTDYLLRDENEAPTPAAVEDGASDSNVRRVSMEEASAFLALCRKQAPTRALAVSLCVLSPIPLLMILSRTGEGPAAGVGSIIGVVILLLLVVAAVVIFLRQGMESKEYEYLEQEDIETAYGVSGMVKEKQAAYRETCTRGIIVGVVLCILSAIPVLLGTLAADSVAAPERIMLPCVSLLLAMVAVAVYLFVRVGMVQGSFQRLLEEGDYTREGKRAARSPIVPIINLLKELQRKRGLTYLFVAHDMSVIRYISDRVGVMYLGHLVEEGDTDEVFDHPQHPYTRTLMSAVPSIDPRDNRQRILLEGDLPSPIDPPSGCVFHTRCPWATEACKTASCELREVRKGHYAACSRGEQE